MKVEDLLKLLKGKDPMMDVLCTIEQFDRPIQEGDILDIQDVSVVEAEKQRSEAGRAGLRYRSSKNSEQHLIIEITTDF